MFICSNESLALAICTSIEFHFLSVASCEFERSVAVYLLYGSLNFWGEEFVLPKQRIILEARAVTSQYGVPTGRSQIYTKCLCLSYIRSTPGPSTSTRPHTPISFTHKL